MSFIIKEHMIEALDDYHNKSLLMQKYHFEGNEDKLTLIDLKSKVNDDLIFHVPIYDMLDRKYASFCSLLEALDKKENDPKNNGIHFMHVNELSEINKFTLYYLFRLSGSGINYIPKIDDEFRNTHGFGNFWITEMLLDNNINRNEWLDVLKDLKTPFTNNKGYMLPQFSFKGQTGDHLKKYIFDYSFKLVDQIYEYVLKEKREIYQVVDYGNSILQSYGLKRQNFVLTAFAIDIAEYFPNYVNPNSRLYAGTNATKCIHSIFEKKERKIKEFDFINDCLSFLSERYETTPYSVEDSRACDIVRYIQEYQSKDHIEMNSGIIYENNSILKQSLGTEKYKEFAQNIK